MWRTPEFSHRGEDLRAGAFRRLGGSLALPNMTLNDRRTIKLLRYYSRCGKGVSSAFAQTHREFG